jgi:signal transduction histidine kinase
MSSVRTERLFSSTSFRLSAAYAALLVAAFLTAAAVAWISTKSAAEREVHEHVKLEMDAVQAEIRARGMPEAIAVIRSRDKSPGALEYRLVDGSGRLLVGNLDVENPSLGWSTVKVRDTREAEDEAEDFLTLTEGTPNGAVLTIGDDLDKAEGVRATVLSALLWVAVPTLFLVMGGGLFLARGSARRMQSLTHAMREVGRGDLAVRAPEAGGDEIARIGQGVNEMVARIDSLVVNIRRVSTDIAHDLRTPLAHVRQDLETAAVSADPVTREGIRGAQARIDDILRVFQAILRLAEIDAGGARVRFAEVDLAGILERVTDAYRPDIEAAGHILSVDRLEPAVIKGDQDLIVQALANLLENAMRHTPEGTAIRVSLRKSSEDVGFAVEDQGPGIPEAERGRVIEPFVRLDRSRSTPGAGLGLSIVQAVARLHGARLRMEEANPGLRVIVEWPI